MKYKTNKIDLNERQLDLRIGLVNLINSHVEERGITQEELTQVIEGLDTILDDSHFRLPERDLDNDLENWLLNERFK